MHTNLKLNVNLLIRLVKTSVQDSSEYADNRLSLFSAQDGKANGTDDYKNLILVSEPVHKLIHATRAETIEKYCSLLKLRSLRRR